MTTITIPAKTPESVEKQIREYLADTVRNDVNFNGAKFRIVKDGSAVCSSINREGYEWTALNIGINRILSGECE